MTQADPRRMDAPLLAGAAMLGALLLPTAASWALDPRPLQGASVWDKPLKFELSLGLHLLTLAVALRLFPDRLDRGERRTLDVAAVLVAACAVLEALYIVVQSARGRASHFNRDTTWESLAYFGAMGGGALAILAGTGTIGWLLWRHERGRPHRGMQRGMALGLVLGSLATLVVVVPLSSGMVDGLGHWVGGVRTDAFGMPITGWATRGGDLRVPHFFATHLMQALPLAGWIADRVDPSRTGGWIRLAAAGGLALAAATLVQAIAGRPFLP